MNENVSLESFPFFWRKEPTPKINLSFNGAYKILKIIDHKRSLQETITTKLLN